MTVLDVCWKLLGEMNCGRRIAAEDLYSCTASITWDYQAYKGVFVMCTADDDAIWAGWDAFGVDAVSKIEFIREHCGRSFIEPGLMRCLTPEEMIEMIKRRISMLEVE